MSPEFSKGRRGKAEGSYVSFSYGIEPILKESHFRTGGFRPLIQIHRQKPWEEGRKFFLLPCALCIRAFVVNSGWVRGESVCCLYAVLNVEQLTKNRVHHVPPTWLVTLRL
jgi:hypothetical protein